MVVAVGKVVLEYFTVAREYPKKYFVVKSVISKNERTKSFDWGQEETETCWNKLTGARID